MGNRVVLNEMDFAGNWQKRPEGYDRTIKLLRENLRECARVVPALSNGLKQTAGYFP